MHFYGLFCILLVVTAAYSEMVQLNTPASARTLRRIRNGRMFERCFGKEKFADIKKQIGTQMQKCLQSTPDKYIVKHFTKSDVPGNVNDTVISRIERQIGNYTCLLENMNFINHTLNVNIEAVQKYVGDLIPDNEMSESLKNDAEDCSIMARATPARLIGRSLQHYKYINEMMVRLGIMFHCFRGRLLMTCNEKDYQTTKKPHPPMWALALARITFLNREEYAFEDFFGLMEDSSVWFSFSSSA